jgi:hypothetical protein
MNQNFTAETQFYWISAGFAIPAGDKAAHRKVVGTAQDSGVSAAAR